MGFSEFISEARKSGVTFKETQVKGVITKVTAQLEAHDAGVLTKLAGTYHKLDKAIDKIKEHKEKINADLKDLIGTTFDPELDKFYTRVLATGKFTATLAKETKPEDITEQSEIDYVQLVEGLKKLIDASLMPQAEELLKSCTRTWKPEQKSPKLTVKNLDEDIASLYAKVSKFVRGIKNSLEKLFSKFDKEFSSLEDKYEKMKK